MPRSERSAVTASVNARLRQALAWWRRRRLHLAGLSPVDRRIAGTAVSISFVLSAIILWVWLAGHAPGGMVQIPSFGRIFLPKRVPSLAAFAGLVGAAVAVLALARASVFRSRIVRIVSIIVIGFVGMSTASVVVSAGRAEEAFAARLDDAGFGGFATIRPEILVTLGWVSTICAAAFVTLALARPAWHWTAALAGVPFALALGALIVARGTISPSAATATSPEALKLYRVAAEFDGSGYVTASLTNIVAQMEVLAAILGFWGAIMYARVARDLSLRAVRSARVTGGAVAVLIGIKLAWLGAGLAGALPGVLGGGSEAWGASSRNGIAAWAVVGLITLAGAVLLARRPWPQLDEGAFTRAGWIVTAAWQWLGLVFGGMLFAFVVADGLLPGGWGSGTISNALSWLLDSDLLLQAQALAVVLALPVGVLLLRRPHWRAVGAFLLGVGVWSTPRALNVLFAPDSPHYVAAPRALTLDAAITVAASALLVLWFLRRQTAVPPTVIAFIVVAFSMIVDARILASAWFDAVPEAVFYVGLAAPVVIRFALDSEDLNVLDADRAPQVLTATGLFAAVMGAVTFQMLIGTLDAATPSDADVARLVFLPAFLAVLIANAIAQLRMAEDPAGVL